MMKQTKSFENGTCGPANPPGSPGPDVKPAQSKLTAETMRRLLDLEIGDLDSHDTFAYHSLPKTSLFPVSRGISHVRPLWHEDIIQEYIPLGQRVDGYTIECRVDGQWQTVFSSEKIGYKRIIFAGRSSAKDLKLPPCDAVRLRIDNSLACPLINNFQIIGTES